MKHFTLFTILLLSVATARAQLNPTLYHIKDLPLNNQLNPSFQPRNGSLYVGFPALTSLSGSGMLSGEGFTLGNAYLSPRYKAIVDGKGDGALTFGYEHNFLNFGFRVKDWYFTFDSKLKLSADGRIPKDLERLMWYGNGADETLGKKLILEGLRVSALGYGEISLGASKEVMENLFVGAKVKYLQGLAYMQAGLGEGSYFETDEDTYNISVGLRPEIYLSGIPVTAPQGESLSLDSLINTGLGSYKFDAGNMGVGFDLGGSWDVPWVKGLNVSASVLDLGFVNWSGHKVTPHDDLIEVSFEGLSLSGGKDFTSGLLDSLQKRATVKSTGNVSQRVWLSPTVYVGASYELTKYLNAGALLGYRFSKYDNLPLAALSVNTQGFMVNGSVSYSYYNRNHNVGAGLLIGRKAMQWHIIADNLLAISYKTAQNVSVRTGISFLFGKGMAKRGEPLAGGDALNPTGAGSESVDSASVRQPDTLGIAPDTATAAIRLPKDSAQSMAKDTVKKAKPAAASTKAKKTQAKLSREDLLKRAMQEEMESGDTVKPKPKSKKPSVAPKPSKNSLLERALREEAEDKSVKVKKKKKK